MYKVEMSGYSSLPLIVGCDEQPRREVAARPRTAVVVTIQNRREISGCRDHHPDVWSDLPAIDEPVEVCSEPGGGIGRNPFAVDAPPLRDDSHLDAQACFYRKNHVAAPCVYPSG